ncbi:hypothetical protein L202_04884 [Cryptococcus amylolentus CBS 6039]|uniref:Uncharacterized protein n=1 Tax=Cryptococcus amylolentus CBS 6039 TaxID=1295533 RepID=A0A1E3HN32_9TREE|nr:hypothetical protein L202_04884 [Cryptococcus amylolentus CBS 6039]ODN77747.1 hypothetical protein L202_04884 [Cryptococcus amylolentus CBS 6039]
MYPSPTFRFVTHQGLPVTSGQVSTALRVLGPAIVSILAQSCRAAEWRTSPAAEPLAKDKVGTHQQIDIASLVLSYNTPSLPYSPRHPPTLYPPNTLQTMGNCFSDPSHTPKPKGKGQVLGSAPAPSSTPHQPQQQGYSQSTAGSQRQGGGRINSHPAQSLGGSVNGGGGGDARDRALRAAEERAKAAQGKGVHASNPKAGQLSGKLAAQGRTSAAQGNQNERMMDAGQWN